MSTGQAAAANRFEAAIEANRGKKGTIIPLLQAAQEHFGYVPEEAIFRIGESTGVPVADLYGIITFYAQFRLRPMGRNVIRVCEGTSCHVNGAKMIMKTIEDELGIVKNETDASGLFTLLSVACIGCCSLAPVIMVNNDTHGRLTPAKIRKIVKGYKRAGAAAAAEG